MPYCQSAALIGGEIYGYKIVFNSQICVQFHTPKCSAKSQLDSFRQLNSQQMLSAVPHFHTHSLTVWMW